MGRDAPHAENLSKHVTLSDDPSRTGAVWREELWRSKLGSRCEYQKLRLNLGPIISAPAAKGNFSTSPLNSHHLWGLGLWRHTRGILLLESDRVSASFVLLSDKARLVCKMHILPPAMLASLMFVYTYQHDLKLCIGRKNLSLKCTYRTKNCYLIRSCKCKVIVEL